MTRTGGQVIVDSLIAHGVTTTFGVPGESYLPVLDALHDKINERIASGVRKMVLNLAPVAFMDSFAIGIIVATARAMSKADGQLKLCGVGERVLMSLTITRLDRTLDIVDNEETAIRSLRGEA